MWLRCARPGTVGASQVLPSATRFRTRPGATTPSQDEREARRAAEEAKRAAEQAAAAAEAAAEAAAQGAGDMPPPAQEESKSTWGETMATVVGAAAPTILAGVVLYYLTRTPQ